MTGQCWMRGIIDSAGSRDLWRLNEWVSQHETDVDGDSGRRVNVPQPADFEAYNYYFGVKLQIIV